RQGDGAGFPGAHRRIDRRRSGTSGGEYGLTRTLAGREEGRPSRVRHSRLPSFILEFLLSCLPAFLPCSYTPRFSDARLRSYVTQGGREVAVRAVRRQRGVGTAR